jgi:hypothetical protein
MFKKGQAALEFLMTYGWAILVVLVAIGALAYFGVLNPGAYLPNTCLIGPGFSCDDFKVDGTGAATVIIKNGGKETITNITLSMGTEASTSTCVPSASLAVGSSTTCTWAAAAVTATSGEKFTDTLAFGYLGASGLSHTTQGKLTVKVE